jgi:hypothetical protein
MRFSWGLWAVASLIRGFTPADNRSYRVSQPTFRFTSNGRHGIVALGRSGFGLSARGKRAHDHVLHQFTLEPRRLSSFADYEIYRERLASDPDAQQNIAHATQTRCILVEERSFLYRASRDRRRDPEFTFTCVTQGSGETGPPSKPPRLARTKGTPIMQFYVFTCETSFRSILSQRPEGDPSVQTTL